MTDFARQAISLIEEVQSIRELSVIGYSFDQSEDTITVTIKPKGGGNIVKEDTIVPSFPMA